jgi:hypothetical protein
MISTCILPQKRQVSGPKMLNVDSRKYATGVTLKRLGLVPERGCLIVGIQQETDQSIEQSGQPTEPPAEELDTDQDSPKAIEYGGPKGPEPTRYGDWEQAGRCTDF